MTLMLTLYMSSFKVCNHAMVALHIDNIKGENGHHIAETIFKAFGRALDMLKELISKNMKKTAFYKGVL